MPRRKMTETDKFLMKMKKDKKNTDDFTKRELEDAQELRIPDPAYYHKEGDRVYYGRWDYTEVLEVCDGGKYYKLFSCTMSNHYGTKKYQDKIHYEPWYGLRSYGTAADQRERFTEDEDIHFQYSQRDVSSLISRMTDRYGIDLNPPYQRGNVWSLQQKQALIDSMFKNIDIGKFSIIKRPWGNNSNRPETQFLYEMLDGKQRLNAIFEFYISRFTYQGLLYHELHPRDQEQIKRYTVSVADIQPMTDEQKYRYFLKLNTSGIPVSEEHLDKVREMWLKEKKG